MLGQPERNKTACEAAKAVAKAAEVAAEVAKVAGETTELFKCHAPLSVSSPIRWLRRKNRG